MTAAAECPCLPPCRHSHQGDDPCHCAALPVVANRHFDGELVRRDRGHRGDDLAACPACQEEG